jgi:N-methylhydantoinase A
MDAVFREIEVGMRGRLPAGASPLVRRSFDGRLLGQTWETPFIKVPSGRITEDSISEMIESFHEEYKRRFGHRFDHLPVQGVTYRVELILPSAKVEYDQIPIGSRRPDPKRKGMLRFLSEQPLEVLEYERGELRAGDRILGPAIIRESFSTTLVGPAQQAMVGSYGELIIERGKESQ